MSGACSHGRGRERAGREGLFVQQGVVSECVQVCKFAKQELNKQETSGKARNS
jgi:hypothetical protein